VKITFTHLYCKFTEKHSSCSLQVILNLSETYTGKQSSNKAPRSSEEYRIMQWEKAH